MHELQINHQLLISKTIPFIIKLSTPIYILYYPSLNSFFMASIIFYSFISATSQFQYNKYYHFIELKMQSQEEKAADLDRAVKHIKVTQSLNEKLKSGKNIIFIFTLHQTVGEQIVNVAKWVLKQASGPLANENHPEKLVEKTYKVYFYQLNLHIVENHYYQVIAVDATSEQGKPHQAKLNLTLASSIIETLTQNHGKQIKAFGAFYSSKDKSSVLKAVEEIKGFIGQTNDLTFISANTQQKSYQICRVENKQISYQKFDVNKYGKFSFANFIKNNLAQVEIKRELQTWRRFIQNFLIAFITPFKQILTNIVNMKDFNKKFICNDLVAKIKQALPQGNQELERVESQKNDEEIAYEWFCLQCLKIKEKYMKQLKQKKDPIDLMKRFFDEFFHQINQLPTVTSLNLVYARKFSNMLIEQLNQLQGVSMEYLSPQVTPILAELAAKDSSDREIDSQAFRYKIAERLTNMEVSKNKPSAYYYLFDKLIKQAFENLKLDNTANKTKLLAGQKRLIESIPLLRIQAIIRSQCTSRGEINREIEYIREFFLEFLRKPAAAKNDWSKLLNIFAKSGQKLKNYGLPELAIEIFKKIRFQFMVQQSAKDLILKNGWTKSPQMSNLYSDLSTYFEKIGNLDKSLKYSELAYENCPTDLDYLTKLIDKKRRFLKSEINKEEVTIINKFSDKNLDAYFNYEFPSKFKEDLENKDYLLLQTEASFQMDRSEDLASLLNFYGEF